MTVKCTMLGSLEVLDEGTDGKPGAGQVYWATDPVGDVDATQDACDALDEREQSLVKWLQDTTT